jgi:hypothetical protein
MAKRGKKWPVVAGLIFIVGFIVAMLLTTSGESKYHCEVCMSFNGGTVCRNGGAPTKEEAQRIATEAACTDLGAGGFSNCRNLTPVSLKWK